MSTSINWKPESNLEEKIIALASQRGQSPETIITEAVNQYLKSISIDQKIDDDPLIGLFAGSPDLATCSEDILQQAVTENPGWTWK